MYISRQVQYMYDMLWYYLQLQGREFTADDYETLLQLDAPAASQGRAVEVGPWPWGAKSQVEPKIWEDLKFHWIKQPIWEGNGRTSNMDFVLEKGMKQEFGEDPSTMKWD